jgi:sec-independent protein translocase protein TatA
MLAFLEGAELYIVLGIVVLIFGGSQIPKLAKSLGQAQKEFKKGIAEGNSDEEAKAVKPE